MNVMLLAWDSNLPLVDLSQTRNKLRYGAQPSISAYGICPKMSYL